MKIKKIIIYCNKVAGCPFLKLKDSVSIPLRALILHKITEFRVGHTKECVKINSLCALIITHQKQKYIIYIGKTHDAIVILNAGPKSNTKQDTAKAHLYWKDFLKHKSNRVYVDFIQDLHEMLKNKQEAFEYLKSTSNSKLPAAFLLSLKDVLTAQEIEASYLDQNPNLPTQALKKIFSKDKPVPLQKILLALGLHLSLQPFNF